ncbi:hypothetical protein OS493_011169 [Desmophyllum pertusum]|uniref:Uncharacterized protein n=1 Tax=Desmophyllum pertusum TaxID=174260 RepID=A0A9W9Z237_9CNID|nr:hypothetical protein OS493_011169 [Desmophyllum pertusum]
MGRWQTVMVTVFFVLLVMLQFSSVEAKKRKKPTLRQLCNDSGSDSGSRKMNIVELHAFFDLSKAFACLKMETCLTLGYPICFVEDTPDLGRENLNNCNLWNLLLQVLQTNRKIEPVRSEYPGSNAKFRTDHSWDEAVSTLCHNAKNVFRFTSGDTGEEGNTSNNGTSKNSSSTDITQDTGARTNRSTAVPTNGRTGKSRQGGPFNRLIRKLLRSNRHKTNSNLSCGVLDGCTRICFGQNEKFTNVSDCSTFKIECTSKKLFRRSPSRKKQKGERRKQKGKGRKKPARSEK